MRVRQFELHPRKFGIAPPVEGFRIGIAVGHRCRCALPVAVGNTLPRAATVGAYPSASVVIIGFRLQPVFGKPGLGYCKPFFDG